MMAPVKISKRCRVVVLGAGASRSVSYAFDAEIQSPLDSDFFDLVQRQSVRPSSSYTAQMRSLLQRMKGLPLDYWRTMERSFYTLQLQAYLSAKLSDSHPQHEDAEVMLDFAVSIQALLRAAHGKRTCLHHQKLLNSLEGADAVISFNYDLVAERALRGKFEASGKAFGTWVYSFPEQQNDNHGPVILKLHGSSNWKLGDRSFGVRTKSWNDFDRTPGYRGHSGEGTEFPIFLPFWDKRIEQEPWLSLWQKAFARLSSATELLVWGYSLPPTDIKAQQLFLLALKASKYLKLCVVDPSTESRARWRRLFPDALYWEYQDVDGFLRHPPKWWGKRSEEAVS